MIKKDFAGLIILLTFAIILSMVYNYFSPNGIAHFGQWEKQNGVISANAKNDFINPSIEINDLELVKQIVKNQERTILDVRSRQEFVHGHLPGAHSFPLEEFDDVIDALFELVKPDSPILVYCSSVECAQSHTFATMLKDLGFTDVKVYAQGFLQWLDNELEIETDD